MPDPNNQDPNNSNQPSSTGDSSSVPPVFSPSADLPPLPPDFQSDGDTSTPPATAATTSTLTPPGTSTTTTQTVSETSEKSEDSETPPVGSAAPVDLPPVVTSGPKKKFGGGRVIATILGIFLLVGGVAGGVLLTQQQQLFEQKAAFSQACYDDCRDNDGKGHLVCMCRCGGDCYRPDATGIAPGGAGCSSNSSQTTCNASCHSDGNSACVWRDGGCHVSGQACNPNESPTEQITAGNCSSTQTQAAGWFQCGSGTGGSQCTFCLKAANRTCNQVLAERQCGTGVGSCGAVTGAVNIYYCPGSGGVGSTGGVGNGCQQNLNNPPANMSGARWNPGDHTITGSFCGTVQVDQIGSNPLNFCSRTDTSGCNVNTPPPTAPPIQASCVNVKAYNTAWTQLTAAQLSALTPGTTVNFCVTGNATGGSFDKARFTINTVAQAETTTRRPNSQDFCQSYQIAANARTVDVQAQIHHATLGWR